MRKRSWPETLALGVVCVLMFVGVLSLRACVRAADGRECEARGGHLESVHGTKYGGWTCDTP